MAASTFSPPPLTQVLIQDAFHFDTNEFLTPVDGEVALVDYEDLFSLLNQPADPGSGGSSGGDVPQQTVDSVGWVASPALPQAPSAHAQKSPLQPQQSEPKASKTSRDPNSKRTRDGGTGRNKQQQVKELEELAAKKNEQLQRLLQENLELKFRSHILEKVVQLRDHQLKVLRGKAEDLPQFWGARAALTPAPADAAAAADGAGARLECGASGASSCCNAADVVAINGLSAAAVVRTASSGCLVMTSGLTLTAADRERFRSLSKTQLTDGWKHFLSEVAVPLLALESDGKDEQAASRLRQLAAEATYLLKHASLLAPDTCMVVSQTHLETGALQPAEPEHWHNVVRTLELTREQVRELRAVFQLFSDITAGILAERRRINARLAEGVHGSVEELRAALEQLTVSPECEVLQALQRSMRREKTAHLLLRGFLFGRTLSVLQFVRAAVYSYPWMPDATALVATVVEKEEEEAAAAADA